MSLYLERFNLGNSNSYLYERCAAHGKAKHVGHDVVDDDHHDGHDEPDEPLKHVLDDEVALGDHTEQGHMGPGKQGELQEMKQMRNRLETVKLGKLGKTKEMI